MKKSYYDKAQELQSEMFGILLDHLRKGVTFDNVRYYEKENTIHFLVDDRWLDEYEVDFWVVVDIVDNLLDLR